MKYSEQLQDRRWKEKAQRVKVRDAFKCVLCDSKKQLNVHHKRYAKKGMAWDVEDSDLITLCRDCHSKYHGHYKVNNAEERKSKRVERSRTARERKVIREEDATFQNTLSAEYAVISAGLELRGLTEGGRDGQYRATTTGIEFRYAGKLFSYSFIAKMAQKRTKDSFAYKYIGVDEFIEWAIP